MVGPPLRRAARAARVCCASLALASCAAPAAVETDAARTDAGATRDDAGATRDGGRDDARVPARDAGACAPSGGPTIGGAYCDQFALEIHTSADAAPEVRLRGRVRPDAIVEGACAAIDEVEVLRGAASLGALAGVGVFEAGASEAILARGAPLAGMTERCARDAERSGGFGLVVRGRIEGARFEARCADAEGGSRWPPALVVTCHHGVDDAPFSSYAGVMAAPMGHRWSELSLQVPHDEGGALLAIDASVRVIPIATPFGPPMMTSEAFDVDGWSTTVSEGSIPVLGRAASQAHLSRDGAAFPIDLCPAPHSGVPGPDDPLPPVFVVRVTGATARGAFSTEALVDYCFTSGG